MTRLHALRVALRSERGAALVMALLVLVLLTAFGLTLIGLGLTEVAISTNWRDYTKDFYAAEAALESGVAGLKALLQSTPPASIDQTTLDNQIKAPALNTPGTNYTVFSVTPVIPFPNNTYSTKFASGSYKDLAGIVSAYQIRAQVAGQGGTRADLTQVFQYTQVPLFQFGVFYGKGVDLEIAPGPSMVFNGRVHANSNIYMVAGTGLSFRSYITTAGSIYRTLKRDNPGPYPPSSYTKDGNDPQIMDNNGVYQPLSFDSVYQPGFSSKWASQSDWVAKESSTFGGMVKDSAMGVGEITPPIRDLFQPKQPGDPGYQPPDVTAHQMIEMPKAGDSPALQQAKLYSQAGLRIIDGVATDANGYSVPLPAGGVTTKTFWDAREGKTMTVTQLDVGVLRGAGAFPSNGVVYVAGTNPASNPAVRLVNGTQLPSQGLTVVSQNPVYVLGDYNTVSKVPAAVMGDAITVLSNAWASGNYDTQTDNTKRIANTTTVNAAFALAPSVESTQSHGNGQLENSIRFLEQWNGKNFTYAGSIIALWHSQQATAPWACCNYYSPPNRIWSYDTLFSTTPPPGTPQGIVMSRGRWSQS